MEYRWGRRWVRLQGLAAADGVLLEPGLASAWGPGSLSYTLPHGRVFDERITAVEVTWGDDQVQRVEVLNGTYLAARLNLLKLIKITGLDETGNVVYTYSPDEGK